MLRETAIRLGLLAVGLGLAVLGLEGVARFAPGLLLPGAVRTPLQLKVLEDEVRQQLRDEYDARQPYQFHPEEPSLRTGRPNLRYASHGLDHSARVAYSSLGIRDREPEALGDRPVALLLGDSFVEARQHAAERTPSARLEGLLEARSEPWWVVNAGIGATGTANQLHLFEHLAPRLRPRLAILVMFPSNDLVNNSLPLQSYETLLTRWLGHDLDARPPERWPRMLRETRRSHYRIDPDGRLVHVPRLTPLAAALRPGEYRRFVERVRQGRAEKERCREARRERRFPWNLVRRLVPHAYATLSYRLGEASSLRCRTRLDGVPMELVFASERIRAAHADWIEESWAVTAALLERLQRQAARQGAELVLAVLPHSIDVDPVRRARLLAEAGTDAGAAAETPQARAVRMGRELGLPTLDLAPAFGAQEDPAALYLPLDPHLSAAGIELLARELAAAFPPASPGG